MGQNRSSAIAVCKIDGDSSLLYLRDWPVIFVCLFMLLFVCLSVLLNVLGFIFDETQCAANVVLY